MVKFAAVGTEAEARMFLRVLTNVHPDASEVFITADKMKVVVPARAILLDPPAREGATRITLLFTFRTGNVQIRTRAALEVVILERLIPLEKFYVSWLRAPADAKPPVQIASPVLELLQAHTHRCSETTAGVIETISDADVQMNLPCNDDFTSRMVSILRYVDHTLVDYPQVRNKLQAVITKQFIPDASQDRLGQHVLQAQVVSSSTEAVLDYSQSTSIAGVQCRDYEDWTIA